jgi:hypothetical protein
MSIAQAIELHNEYKPRTVEGALLRRADYAEGQADARADEVEWLRERLCAKEAALTSYRQKFWGALGVAFVLGAVFASLVIGARGL